MRKKISTTIYVTPEQSDRLKMLHERTKVPVAVYIREGIDLVLKHYSHLLPGQLPLTDALADADAVAKTTRSLDFGGSQDTTSSAPSNEKAVAGSKPR